MSMEKSYIIKLSVNSDCRGKLVSLENKKTPPFDIKRVFYIYGVPNYNIERGNHTNIHTKHLLVALKGSCTVECTFDNEIKTYILDSPNIALYIDNEVSKKMYNFTEDSILLCLCSELYDENEYKI